jgi:hypothetical protein
VKPTIANSKVASLVLAAFFFAAVQTADAADAEIRLIRSAGKITAVDFIWPTGVEPVGRNAFAKFCRVTVVSKQSLPGVGQSMPGIAGDYTRIGQKVRFEPTFPFRAGVNYLALFGIENQDALVVPFAMAVRHSAPGKVAAIFPSADVLPENLLKFYVHFSKPMRRGNIYQYIRLLGDNDVPVDLPFLEINEELWTEDLKRLTLFIDPGRIKRGVKPLEDIGPAIEFGHRYTLVIRKQWQDETGQPLESDFRKTFTVTVADRLPIKLETWKIRAPRPGTSEPLVVSFGESMDNALAQRVIWLVDKHGREVSGKVRLTDHERTWRLTPTAAWSAGGYALKAEHILEDLAGNNIGKPFEVDVFERVDGKIPLRVSSVPFEI